MKRVRPKKRLGQHFLKDESVSQRIAEAVCSYDEFNRVLEVGPGTGALTKFLLQKPFETLVIELDRESVQYLNEHYKELSGKIIEADFLKADLQKIMGKEPFAVVGNFPYYISSQIIFKALENKEQIPLVVGMFQKELAERIAEGPGSKRYGVISVLTQAFYDVEYLFTVDETVFDPPPKVKSAVIRLKRNETKKLNCDESLFREVVKKSFNQRRKTLRNSLKSIVLRQKPEMDVSTDFFSRRPETLSVVEFVELTQQLSVKT